MDEYIKNLKNRALTLKGPNKRLRHLKYTDTELVEYLNNNYPSDITFAEKLYWFTHDINDYPRCLNCGKRLKFKDGRDGYGKYCSGKCSNSSKDKIQLIKNTKLINHGDPNYNNREKSKKTCIEIYGVDNPLKNKDIHDKQINTSIKRYGVINAMQLDEYQEKVKQTKLERYGDPYYVNKEKRFQTNLERYGNPYYSNINQICETKLKRYGNPYYTNSEKRKQTCLKKYGVENIFELYEFQKKSQETNIKKYGTINPLFNDEIKKKLSNSIKNSFINKFDFLTGYTDDGNWICKCPHQECNKCSEKCYESTSEIHRNRVFNHAELCTKLNPITPYACQNSGLERFIIEILDNNDIQYERKNKKILNGLELDFYMPSFNIAIECNGCYWHSTAQKPKNYHINKYKMCREKGIKLISIWEDQIVLKPKIIKSFILGLFNKYENIINIDDCELCNITNCSDFLNENHIYGKSNSSVNLGLKYNDKLVYIMTFDKTRKKEDEWYISRYCNLLNTKIPSADTLLLNEFINTYNPKILTYSSFNDIGDDSLCINNGFKPDPSIESNHWFIQHWKLDRFKKGTFTIQKLKKMGIYDKEKTFDKMMDSIYFRIIYDSGKTTWHKLIDNKNE